MTFTLYQEQILDHNKHPRNRGPLLDATFSHRHVNPSCGDNITLHVRVEGDVIKDVWFEGVGCAISTASTSMFTLRVKGMKIDEARQLTSKIIYELLGIPISPGRERCALLPLRTFQDGLKEWYE